MVSSILANDKESFMQAFNAAIANKVTDVLELKKVELASTLMGDQSAQETTNELEVDDFDMSEVEVDLTADNQTEE